MGIEQVLFFFFSLEERHMTYYTTQLSEMKFLE